MTKMTSTWKLEMTTTLKVLRMKYSRKKTAQDTHTLTSIYLNPPYILPYDNTTPSYS
jgi:hypothetical protein